MKYTALLLFFLLSFSIVNAQTGPAGVGSSSSNILWNRSEDISGLSNGDTINLWDDNSGNNYDLSQDSNLISPIYKTNIQNGFPVVRFDASRNTRLIKNNFANFPADAITIFMVNKNSESSDGLFCYATSSANSGNDVLIYNSANFAFFRNGTQKASGESINNNTWHIVDISWTKSGGDVEFWKDNGYIKSDVVANNTAIISNGCLSIGNDQDDKNGGYLTSDAHTGDFLELIVYNIELNSAQRIIVGNYLAAKYNLTISNDLYAYQGTYSHELAGIGRYDASNTHTVAQSAGMLTVDGASDMTSNNEYLLFAHDNGSLSSWSSTGSAYNTQKIAREWRIDETGDVGTVDFTLDEDSVPALAGDYTKYGLMVDADGDFTSGARVYEMKLSSGDYKASSVEVNDGDYMSIVAIKPTVYFDITTGNAEEINNAAAPVVLNYYPAPSSSVTVDYSTADGTATIADNDYTAVSGSTLTFGAGVIEQTASVTVINNTDSEGNEDFTITISNPSLGLNIGTSATYTHTIIDDDNLRKIKFNSSTSSNSESTTSVNIQVEINNIDNVNATTADYAVTGGTATGGGTDYTLANGTVTISSGSTTANINVTIVNDVLDEVDETIIIELSNPSNASLGTIVQHTYTINDNDDAPTIYFTTTSSSGSEVVSSKTIEVKISEVSTKDISVSFASSGTATSGTDYSVNTSSPITIAAGNTTKDISISITDDVLQESDETVVLTLSAPTNATIGANNPYTYTINDDEWMGYDGPAGVGSSTSLKLWLKADDIPGSSNGDRISSWSDQSGNGNSLSSSGDVRPHYYDNQANGYPVVRFGVLDNTRLVKTSFNDFPTSEITFYTARKTSNSDFGEYSYATSSSASGNELLAYNHADKISIYRNNSSQSTNVNIPDGWAIFGTLWSTDYLRLYVNGARKYNASSSVNSNIVAGGCLAIGAEQDALNSSYHNTDDFEGDFAEVVIFNKLLNSARNNIVNNYLSAKYNIGLTSNDKYAGDDSGNGDYDFEVIGIGQESDGPHVEAHRSGGLWIKQNSNFDNGDYLFIGHSEVEPQLYTPAEDAGLTAPSIDERWGRDWYFDITGSITVDLTFDFTEAEMNSSSTPAGTTTNYKLLYRAGTSGNWSIVSSASSKTASQIVFSGQSLPNGDGYYALGTIDASNSPLPIELISFDAEVDGKNVVLDWKTASETNNDYFEIYRSSNTKDWKVIANIEGSGTTNSVHSYNFVDNKALDGVGYYKLKQVDFDGEYSFSSIRSVDMGLSQGIEIYPNPTTGTVYINNLSEGSIVEVLDMNSRLIELKTIYTTNAAKIDMSNLPKSVYYVKVISHEGAKVFKIIKN